MKTQMGLPEEEEHRAKVEVLKKTVNDYAEKIQKEFNDASKRDG
jgi:hypothetical protein